VRACGGRVRRAALAGEPDASDGVVLDDGVGDRQVRRTGKPGRSVDADTAADVLLLGGALYGGVIEYEGAIDDYDRPGVLVVLKRAS